MPTDEWERGYTAGWRAAMDRATMPWLAPETTVRPENLVLPNPQTQPKKRRVSKYQKTLGKEIRIFDAKARLKNGSYRSGWDRAKVMRLAHKATRKILNMR